MTHRVFIVDAHDLVRIAYSLVLEREPDLQVCGEAYTAIQALSGISETRPDIVLTGIELPDMNGFTFTEQVKAAHPHLPVFIVSAHLEEAYAVNALVSGANGYLIKTETDRVFLEAVRYVLRGGIFLSRKLKRNTLLHHLKKITIDSKPIDRLTDRELEMLELLGRGMSIVQVATIMVINPLSVSQYRRNIEEKLGTTDCIAFARQAVNMPIGQTLRTFD